MHYEGELVAIIGRSCRQESRPQRPSIMCWATPSATISRCGIRDRLLPPAGQGQRVYTFGPAGSRCWSRRMKFDPTHVERRTYLNGELKQDGNTKDLRHSIAQLIEYISEFLPPSTVATQSHPAHPKALPISTPGDVVGVN